MASSYHEIFENRKVVARISNLPDERDETAMAEVEFTNAWAKDYIRPEDNESEPIIDMYFPISKQATESVVQDDAPAEGSVVGLVNANMYFWELLQAILPDGTGGIIAVFSIANTTFSYKINGPNAEFLGRGDLHNPKYDGYLERSDFFLDVSSVSVERTYTGVPLCEETKMSSIRIYPSDEMEANFISNDPMIYTVIAVLTFVFTSALFIIYDRLRTSALRKVVHTAVDANANVALLEGMVKERTRELVATNSQLEEANRRVVQASGAQLQHFGTNK